MQKDIQAVISKFSKSNRFNKYLLMSEDDIFPEIEAESLTDILKEVLEHQVLVTIENYRISKYS